MENFLHSLHPEIIFSSSDSATSRAIGQALKAGKLRKLAARLYTSNLKDSPETIIARNQYFILSKLFPGAILSYRSAFEGGVSKEGIIFLTYKYTKQILLPGLKIVLIKGKEPQKGDTPFMEGLYIASMSRAFLENISGGRTRKGVRKNLSTQELETKLERLCQIHGADELNHIRDQAREISPLLNMEKAFLKLDKLIGAILGTRQLNLLTTDYARARAKGQPYDAQRIELFIKLALSIKHIPLPRRLEDSITSKETLKNLAFFEAYFSNYIEGTKFLIEEGVEIIFKNKIIPHRREDSHDILGTFQIVSSLEEMKKIPTTPQEMIKILKKRHAIMLGGRPDKNPGQFKEQTNQAGNTVFVFPELVTGTLIQSFDIYKSLDPGLSRAVFMMFLISEIHPFTDGNGRIARIMMNAELVTNHENRIIIPTVYREDYLGTLRRLSRSHDPEPYIRMLDRAQLFTQSIDFSNYEKALSMFQKSNAFLEPNEGKLRF
jgi:fido (protein-threonine AMPylation protein)